MIYLFTRKLAEIDATRKLFPILVFAIPDHGRGFVIGWNRKRPNQFARNIEDLDFSNVLTIDLKDDIILKRVRRNRDTLSDFSLRQLFEAIYYRRFFQDPGIRVKRYRIDLLGKHKRVMLGTAVNQNR